MSERDYGLRCKCACGAEFDVWDNSGKNQPLETCEGTAYRAYVEWKEAHKDCHVRILELRARNAGKA